MRLQLLYMALIAVLAAAGSTAWCGMEAPPSRGDHGDQRAIVMIHVGAGGAPCDMVMPASVVNQVAPAITAVHAALAAASTRTVIETPRSVETGLLSVLRAHPPNTQRLLASISLQV